MALSLKPMSMLASCGWWRALIKMIKGDFHVVEYLGWDTTYTEIVGAAGRGTADRDGSSRADGGRGTRLDMVHGDSHAAENGTAHLEAAV